MDHLSIGLSVANHSPPSSSRPPVYVDRYEMRRECQEILPGLILGPLQVAKSLSILQGLGVTHVYVSPISPFNRDRAVERVLTPPLSSQGVHSRRERGVFGQTPVPRSLQVHGRGSRRLGRTESHSVLSSVRTPRFQAVHSPTIHRSYPFLGPSLSSMMPFRGEDGFWSIVMVHDPVFV